MAFTDSDRAALRAHFQAPFITHPSRWEELWEKGELLPWDRGVPSPALVDTLNDKKELLGSARSDRQRKKALVPGCGRGYDVLLLASHGYDAIGLDISESAIKECKVLAEKEASKYLDGVTNPGKYQFIVGDFFSDDWLKSVGAKETRFDFIYDYTFLCALPPEARPVWALRMSKLLDSDSASRLVCLEFPLFKDPNTGGPPFGLQPEVYIAHLSNPGSQVPYDEKGYSNADAQDNIGGALERIVRWKPDRTHPIGKDTDHVSIWKLR